MVYDAWLVVRAAAAALSTAPARRLGAVAAACGVSRYTLMRACLQCGAGSARDLRDAVLHRRMHALMTAVPPKSIKEISDVLGFATPQSFARWLKRTDGVAPTALRAALCRRQAPAARGRGVEAGTRDQVVLSDMAQWEDVDRVRIK
ncbi:MAG: AraC family transcriptional regulator [Vicinamibacterales bacterium]